MTIKLQSTEIYGFETAIRGMRNPMNSWERSDTWVGCDEVDTDCFECENWECRGEGMYLHLGDNDHKLMMNLAKAGSEHAKYLRMINVTVDITAPLYFWKEFDTYKIGTVSNSCSTMHKIQAKEFTLDDFSYEHLWEDSISNLHKTIKKLNQYRTWFLNWSSREEELANGEYTRKDYWWQMIQLLPSSYNQLRTIQLNYAVLSTMYHQRKNHKLDEWREFCDWIKTLPYSELITLEGKHENS